MEKDKKVILVVDDNEINRGMLTSILSMDYDTVDAENGQAAFEMLDRVPDIAAILLDLNMPVMDGHTFLKKLPRTPHASLPVLVLTGSTDQDTEELVLREGAWDFVPKPYSANILLSRLKNAIARSQLYLLEQMRYINEHDALTGLFNRTKYFMETQRMLERHPDEKFALVCFNVDRFRALNSFWGEENGNRFLNFVASEFRKVASGLTYCTYGRIESDIFSMCELYDDEAIHRQTEMISREIGMFKQDYTISVSFGVYVIDDPALQVDAMYVRATLAVAACRTEFTHLCYYRPQMSDAIRQEQDIINEMQPALDAGQFIVYLQPKYNLKNERPYGAEALIRWQHPVRGLISPGVFIPVFERNGFIGKVDYYMWEQTCQLLRKWMDEGLDPAPISVNVSRVNLYNPKFVDNIVALVGKYRIPPDRLNLEITESAYMENPAVMKEAVKALHEHGFIIMMDDFGSGYSSLNTLKDIYVDILKIDMKFLSSDEGTGRGARILASVIRMAGWLDLPVIVEGVETAEQKNFLEAIGCGYVQGYYYARPMPVTDYEHLMRNASQLPVEPAAENIDRIADALWTADPQFELLFRSISQPVVIYEFDGQDYTMLRANQAYNLAFGYGNNIFDKDGRTGIGPAEMAVINQVFSEVSADKAPRQADFQWKGKDGREQLLHMEVLYWGANSSTFILYAQFTNVTELRAKEKKTLSART